ncbi:MAG: FHA domain-containing protein [Deltaproteobacteria bacterium]|nr:FHA domain-containing protein [Deltaproteobacteria bacterium]
MASLYIINNDGRIYNFPIRKKEITIGRNRENDITFVDRSVSRYHARIITTSEGYLLTDLGSYNGTKLNGESIQSVLLQHDDLIRIGHNKLTFLAREKSQPSLRASVVLTPEAEEEEEIQKIVQSSSQNAYHDSGRLLVKMEPKKSGTPVESAIPPDEASQRLKIEEDLSALERSNKVLFVLYEISRQLNTITDFNELLQKIMDLIFMVIDADYGFLILTGEGEEDDLIPVVVRCKDEKLKEKEELKASRTLVNKVIQDKVSLLTSNAMDDSRLDHGKSLIIQQIKSAMCVPLWKKDKIIGVIQLDSVRIANQFTQDDLQLLQTIGSQMAMVIEQASLNEQIREEETMRNRLARFHSPQVIDMILKSGQETKDDIMDPKDLTATILFTDIIGFTRFSEEMPPREVSLILNEYFSKMTDIVFEFDGTLDKYIGDSLMAVFGAPMEKEGDAERAISAALKMRKALAEMMSKTRKDKRFDIRIGINTGRVVAGNIGSPRRMDYTVMGDPVNVASRLEEIAMPNQILIGEETYRHVKNRFDIKKVGPRKVRGKRDEIIVYEVLDEKA